MGKFNFVKTSIEGVTIVEPTVFGDHRGYFMETYNKAEFDAAGLNMVFVQDNESKSKKGVLRGLHFQKKNPQGKLVRVIEGEVFDVAVDLRKGSPTLASGKALFFLPKTRSSSTFPKVLHTALWCSAKLLLSCTSAPACMTPRTKVASCGTTPKSASSGRWAMVLNRYFLKRIPRIRRSRIWDSLSNCSPPLQAIFCA